MLGGLVGNRIKGILTVVAKRSPLGLVYVRMLATAPPSRVAVTSPHGPVESVSTGPDTVTVVPVGPELGDNRRAEAGSTGGGLTVKVAGPNSGPVASPDSS